MLTLTACTGTVRNPEACFDGKCIDPSLPFCDQDGSVAGQANTCIAVSCTAGELEMCRGDQALTCNAAGDNFEVVQCEKGCDASQGGCRVCEAGDVTACTNGTVATCDGQGNIVTSEKCPLGCFEDQPRCREIDPSNGLAQFLDMVPDPPDLDLSAGGSFDTVTGTVRRTNTVIPVPNFLIPAPPGGAAIRVYVANRVTLGKVEGFGGPNPLDVGPALAIVARGEIQVMDTLDVSDAGAELRIATPGGVALPGCIGTEGGFQRFQQCDAYGGDGGGGHATGGGKGGNIDALVFGGSGGAPSGNPTLEPLRGGCRAVLSPGGGAVQLVSRSKISVAATIDARGASGYNAGEQGEQEILGGGAGGGILLEAPVVELGPNAKLLATGGAGSSATTSGSPSNGNEPSLGGTCNQVSPFCGAGGNGAGVGVPAMPGANAALDSSRPLTTAGGGGGGLGFLRINTATGDYVKSSATVEAGSLSTGLVKTR